MASLTSLAEVKNRLRKRKLYAVIISVEYCTDVHAVGLLCMIAALAALADGRFRGSGPFFLRHLELRDLVVAVKDGGPPTAGSPLVAHYAGDPAAVALMFQEDPQTKNVVTVSGGLCITDDHGVYMCSYASTSCIPVPVGPTPCLK